MWYSVLVFHRPTLFRTQVRSIDAGGMLGKFYSSFDPRRQRSLIVSEDMDLDDSAPPHLKEIAWDADEWEFITPNDELTSVLSIR